MLIKSLFDVNIERQEEKVGCTSCSGKRGSDLFTMDDRTAAAAVKMMVMVWY